MAAYIHMLTVAQDRLFCQKVCNPSLTCEEWGEAWHDIDVLEMKKHYVLKQALRAGVLAI